MLQSDDSQSIIINDKSTIRGDRADHLTGSFLQNHTPRSPVITQSDSRGLQVFGVGQEGRAVSHGNYSQKQGSGIFFSKARQMFYLGKENYLAQGPDFRMAKGVIFPDVRGDMG